MNPGNEMAGLVWANTSTGVIAYLGNLSTGEMAVIGCDTPMVSVQGVDVRLMIAGAVAEWILARPAEFQSKRLFPFPDYTADTFTFCSAGTAPAAGPPTALISLAAARLIRMFDVLRGPTRTAFVSMARKQDDTAALVTYGGFPS